MTRERIWLRPALVPLVVKNILNSDGDPVTELKSEAPIWLDDDLNKNEQTAVYEGLLRGPWLAPKVRAAVMVELSRSVRAEKEQRERGRTIGLQLLIDATKRRMRENGERPDGGVHDAAVEEVAKQQGMEVEALKKRLQRLRKLQRTEKRPSK